MAWYPGQVLADYLNWYPDREENERLLRSMLDDEIVFQMGTRSIKGIDAVMKEFSNMSDAISSENGFVARPVIAKEKLADDPERFSQKKAIALCSKLEPYISWVFFFEGNTDNMKITNITSIMGSAYQHMLHNDRYELKHSCKLR